MRLIFALIFFGFVTCAGSQPATEQTKKASEQTEQKATVPQENKDVAKNNYDKTPGWMKGFEAAIATQLQKVSNYCVTKSNNEQDKLLQDFLCSVKVTDVVIAIFSVLLVFVTVGLVFVGWIQARRMRVTARQQLRAYVFVENVNIGNVTTPLAWEVAPGYKPTGAEITHTALGPFIGLLIKNTGQTPAHHVVHFAEAIVREYPLKGRLGSGRIPRFATKSSLPTGGITTKTLVMAKPLLADEVADLKRGTKAIYVYGYIKYRDAFRRRRRTQFRLMYNAASGGVGIATAMTICNEGNTAN